MSAQNLHSTRLNSLRNTTLQLRNLLTLLWKLPQLDASRDPTTHQQFLLQFPQLSTSIESAMRTLLAELKDFRAFSVQFRDDRSAQVITLWHKWITDAKLCLHIAKAGAERGGHQTPVELSEFVEASRRASALQDQLNSMLVALNTMELVPVNSPPSSNGMTHSSPTPHAPQKVAAPSSFKSGSWAPNPVSSNNAKPMSPAPGSMRNVPPRMAPNPSHSGYSSSGPNHGGSLGSSSNNYQPHKPVPPLNNSGYSSSSVNAGHPSTPPSLNSGHSATFSPLNNSGYSSGSEKIHCTSPRGIVHPAPPNGSINQRSFSPSPPVRTTSINFCSTSLHQEEPSLAPSGTNVTKASDAIHSSPPKIPANESQRFENPNSRVIESITYCAENPDNTRQRASSSEREAMKAEANTIALLAQRQQRKQESIDLENNRKEDLKNAVRITQTTIDIHTQKTASEPASKVNQLTSARVAEDPILPRYREVPAPVVEPQVDLSYPQFSTESCVENIGEYQYYKKRDAVKNTEHENWSTKVEPVKSNWSDIEIPAPPELEWPPVDGEEISISSNLELQQEFDKLLVEYEATEGNSAIQQEKPAEKIDNQQTAGEDWLNNSLLKDQVDQLLGEADGYLGTPSPVSSKQSEDTRLPDEGDTKQSYSYDIYDRPELIDRAIKSAFDETPDIAPLLEEIDPLSIYSPYLTKDLAPTCLHKIQFEKLNLATTFPPNVDLYISFCAEDEEKNLNPPRPKILGSFAAKWTQ
eukprot:TRINITY_DN836_c0_g1_i1.p1 TRINITY_DN836_c0_g1~~TRINITY_DN836_c0_g1_i1.p1  ORF type:complete len:751 (+),score=140.27 TRINITY_DN836_c0_g1_i1:121-2373(+)